MVKEYLKPETVVLLADADALLAALSQKVDGDTNTDQQNAKQYTWGNLWEDDQD